MEVAEVSSQPYTISNDQLVTLEESQGIIASPSEEEEATSPETAAQTVSVAHVQLNEVEDTQIGSRSVYHGSVDVNNIFEITANEQFANSTSLGSIQHTLDLPAAIQEVSAAVVGASLYQPSTSTTGAADILQGYNEYLKSTYSRRTQPSTSSDFLPNDPHIEHRPLIKKNDRDSLKFRPKYITLLVLVSSALLVSVILIIIYGSNKENDDNLPPSFTHRYRDRTKWYALPPKHQIPQFKYIPPKFVVVAHTASQFCFTPTNCSVAVRNIQAGQMVLNYDDIAYNFLVGGDGLIYEGRGWVKRSADTPGMGCSSMSVAFVGNFVEEAPVQQQLDAFKLLLDTAESTGRLTKNYQMFMQNQIVLKSKSPGQTLIDILEKWDHWQPFVKADLLC